MAVALSLSAELKVFSPMTLARLGLLEGRARGPLLFGVGGEHATIRALNSLQAGQAAEIPCSGSSFLAAEIAALSESLPS